MTRHICAFGFFVVCLTGCRTPSNVGSSNLKTAVAETPSKTAPEIESPKVSDNEPEIYPQVLTLVAVEPVTKGVDQGSFEYSISAETSLEVWCERLCSEFSLIESTHKGNTVVVEAVKKPIPGNTSPTRLKVTRALKGKTSDVKKIVIKNVGKEGVDIVVSDLITDQAPNFHGGYGAIKPALAIGGESKGYSILYAGKTMDAELMTKHVAAQVAASAGKQLKGFVTGSIVEKKGLERGHYPVFQVRSVDTSAVEP